MICPSYQLLSPLGTTGPTSRSRSGSDGFGTAVDCVTNTQEQMSFFPRDGSRASRSMRRVSLRSERTSWNLDINLLGQITRRNSSTAVPRKPSLQVIRIRLFPYISTEISLQPVGGRTYHEWAEAVTMVSVCFVGRRVETYLSVPTLTPFVLSVVGTGIW